MKLCVYDIPKNGGNDIYNFVLKIAEMTLSKYIGTKSKDIENVIKPPEG
jgi:hypothetical protein